MFSKFPLTMRLDKNLVPKSMPKVFYVHHATVSTSEYFSYGKDRACENHCIFHYTIRGRGEVIYKNKSYFTRAGQGFFNIINDPFSGYRYPEGENDEWEFIVLCFDGVGVREIVGELLENQVVYDLSKKEEKFCDICSELFSYTQNNSDFMTFPTLISLLRENTNLDFIRNFETVVERHVDENPTVLFVADKLKITREHLQREYRRLTGTSPAKYITAKRFERLLHLLSATDLSQDEISRRMFFSSKNAMEQFFKKMSGTTIQKYRKTGYIPNAES